VDQSIRDGKLTKVAEVPGPPSASRRSIFVERAGGQLCLWDAPDARGLIRQGGCNPESDPFAGGQMFVSFSYEGGPKAQDVRDARLIGLLSSSVAESSVALSDGTVRTLALRPAPQAGNGLQYFAYRLDPRDLRRGIGPTMVRAFDSNGRLLDSDPTGFTE